MTYPGDFEEDLIAARTKDKATTYENRDIMRFYQEWEESGFNRHRLRRLHKAIADVIRDGGSNWCACCTHNDCTCGRWVWLNGNEID